jgi:DNA invertase Pin-like site-specific DNA recombinase/ssDNA-binding Zn-finger/Zn-ribbon topoisomerase 1
MQVERLQRSGCDRVYADIGSRDNDERKGLQQAIAMLEAGEVASLSVVRLDRLTSSPILFERLVKLMKAQNIPLITLDESVDIHSMDGLFSADLRVLFGKHELAMIRHRVKKSYENRRAKNGANSQVPFGYKNEGGHYVLDHTPFICLLSDRPKHGEFSGRTFAQISAQIIETFFESGQSVGKTVKAIHSIYGVLKFKHPKVEANLLVFGQEDEFRYSRNKDPRAGVLRWSPDGLRKWLRSPVLRGHTPYKTRVVSGGNVLPQEQWDIRYSTHPNQRLITDAQSQEIEEAIALNRTIRGYGHQFAGNPNTFIGILICDKCGRNMRCQTIKKHGEKYYQCRSYAQERSCDAKKMVKESVTMEAVIEELVAAAGRLSEFALSADEIIEPPEVQQWRQQLDGLNQLGHNSALEEAKRTIQGQIDKWQYEQQTKKSVNDKNYDLLKWAFSTPDYWTSLDKKNQQEVVRSLVREVRSVDGEVISVVLKI